VPEGVFERHRRFVTCDVCRRVFWEGSHWKRMRTVIDAVMKPADKCVQCAPPNDTESEHGDEKDRP